MHRPVSCVARILTLAVALTAGVRIGAAQDGAASARADTGYRLGPQDGLAITVWGHSELTGKFTIAGDGTITFPLLGSMVAGGRTIPELRLDLTRRLADGFLKNPRVNIEIDRYVSQRVFVIGEVHTPGPVSLTGPMSVLEVLARAGSLTEQAGGDLIVLRPSPIQATDGPVMPGQDGTSELGRMSVAHLRRGKVASNFSLRDGDTVFVPRAERIYVLGLVHNPGPYTHETGLTVHHALSLAGGTTPLGSAGRARIVRTVDGKRIELKAGPDVVLLPGDSVVVEARRF